MRPFSRFSHKCYIDKQDYQPRKLKNVGPKPVTTQASSSEGSYNTRLLPLRNRDVQAGSRTRSGMTAGRRDRCWGTISSAVFLTGPSCTCTGRGPALIPFIIVVLQSLSHILIAIHTCARGPQSRFVRVLRRGSICAQWDHGRIIPDSKIEDHYNCCNLVMRVQCDPLRS